MAFNLKSIFKRISQRRKRLDINLPHAPVQRIILHWNAGSYTASYLDQEHYHFLIEHDERFPEIVRGHHSIMANIPPLREGKYAAHTYRANSYAVGVAICGMKGAKDRPLRAGKYPITKEQWELTVQLIAEMVVHFGLKVDGKTILTHAEVTANLGIKQRGKWDIAFLPFWKRRLSAAEIGTKLRTDVKAEVARIGGA